MNPYALLSLAAALANLFVALYVVSRNRRSAGNMLFSLSAFCLFIWGLGEALQRGAASVSDATFFSIYVAGVGAMLFAPLILHFWLVFTGKASRMKRAWLYAIYVPAVAMLLARLAAPGFFIKDSALLWWGYSEVSGPFHGTFNAFVAIYTLFVIIMAVNHYRNSSGKSRTHAKYIALSLLTTMVLGTITQVIPPILGFDFFEMTIISTPLFVIFIAYAIIRHGLLSITPGMAAENVLEIMPGCLAVADTDRKMIIINRAMIETSGYTREELTGKPFSLVCPASVFDEIAINGSVRNYETEIKTKAGKTVPFSLYGSLLRYGGSNVGFVIIMRDVSELKVLVDKINARTVELEKSKKKLEEKVEQLEKVEKLSVGREMKMMEMKKKMEEIKGGRN